MIWLVALGYVGAASMLVAGLSSRVDGRLRTLLGLASSAQARWSSDVIVQIRDAFESRLSRSARTRGLRAQVPDLLDLLAVSVTAGLSPRLSLDRAPELLGGGLGELFAEVQRDVALGAQWHGALESAARISGERDLRRLAMTLSRADRLGVPVSERLRDLAVQVRRERRADREERARRAPVQMLFPLVFLILPAFVLAGVVPALIVATGDVI